MRHEVRLKPLKPGNSRGYVMKAVWSIRGSSGKAEPKTAWFRTAKAAETFKRDKDRELKRYGSEAADIEADERLAVLRWREFRRENPDAPDITRLIADAMVVHSNAGSRQTVQKATEELMESIRRRGLSAIHQRQLAAHLKRFCTTFGSRSIGSITSSEIEGFLYGLGLSPVTFTNNKRSIHQLFAGPVSQQLIPRNPAAAVNAPKAKQKDPEILTPATMRRILAGMPDDLVPLVIVQAFCGVRRAEAMRLKWADIHLDGPLPTIRLASSATKTNTRRTIRLEANAAAWLRKYRGLPSSGITPPDPLASDRLHRARKRLGLYWPSNALRHSYGTYMLVLKEEAAVVAERMGNSAAVVRRHYANVADPADAKAWFDIMPDTGEKSVIPFSATA